MLLALKRFVPVLFSLLIGLVSGLIAWKAGLPLPWMLGPLIGTTIAALGQAPVTGPERLRPVVIPIIGVLLGSGITIEILRAASRWTGSLVLVLPFLLLASLAAYAFNRRVAGYDQPTAFYAAMPGGLNDALILGIAAGGSERRIALAHAVRVFVVVVFVVLFYSLALGVNSTAGSASWVALSVPSLQDWLVLAACAFVGQAIALRLHLPAAAIMGPMLASGVAHVTGLVTVPPPSLVIIAAQIVIGTIIGCRFLSAKAIDVAREIMFGFGSALILLAVAVLFATLVDHFTNVPLSQAFLAFSPGGITEMSLMALAMDEEVAYVSVLHMTRLAMVIFIAKPLFAIIQKLSK